MFKKYLDYLKDNPEHYWFKRKIWGWGWVPATWQGWLATFLYVALVSLLIVSREEAIPGDPDSGSNFLVFGLPFIVLTVLFVFIAYKTGEKPKWQWGGCRTKRIERMHMKSGKSELLRMDNIGIVVESLLKDISDQVN